MYYPFYFSPYPILLLVVPMLLGIWAQTKVSSTFKKYSQMRSRSALTGARAARQILDANGLYHVAIEQVHGNLTDHFDPKQNVVRLSSSVYGSHSVAAIGIAAHECGHAVQHAQGYLPLKIRSAIIPITNIGSRLAVPLIFIGLIFSYPPLVSLGLIGYLLIALFQLITLPVEFNASSRAVQTLSGMGIEGEELKAVKKVLSAAAMTYVASLISAVTQFIRLFLIYGNNRRRS